MRFESVSRSSDFDRFSLTAQSNEDISQMSQDDILTKVTKIVAEQLEVEASEVKAESNFVNDLGADSLDTVELVMALEEEFDIEIPDEAAEGITTVQEAVNYIQEKTASPA